MLVETAQPRGRDPDELYELTSVNLGGRLGQRNSEELAFVHIFPFGSFPRSCSSLWECWVYE